MLSPVSSHWNSDLHESNLEISVITEQFGLEGTLKII